LKSTLRSTDVLARLGGDEFAIIQAECDDQWTGSIDLATRISKLIAEPFLLQGHQVEVGTSIGIAMAPEHGSDQEQLLKKADLALYRSKSAGRNAAEARMSSLEDDRLKTHFANLREEDRSEAPPFGRTVRVAAPFSRRGSSWWIAFAVTPLVAIAVMLAVRAHRPPEAGLRELAAWSSPTTFLLETPGKQLLNQTPKFGEPLTYSLPDRSLPGAHGGPK
jgi:hypothetical protein